MKEKIQLIKYPPISPRNFKDITLSNFNNFHSLDSFNYNFISLNMPKLLTLTKLI